MHSSPGITTRKAIFLDRDGVLNFDTAYPTKISEIRFTIDALDFLEASKEMGFLNIVVTNQSAIARGMMTEENLIEINNYFFENLHNGRRLIDDIYYCPHHPDGIIAQYAKSCLCRKPLPGMITHAARVHHIDLSRSCLIGDKETDIEAGIAANLSCTMLISRKSFIRSATRANFRIGSLIEAIEIIKAM